jgi:predicted TIM-barrel fold metal-dependent hydrolase
MRVIDCHIHNWSIWSELEPIRAALDRFGMDWIALASPLIGGSHPSREQVRESNDRTLAFVREIPDRLLGWAYVNPQWEDQAADELQRGLDAGMIGMKLWTATRCSDPRVFPLVEICIERNVPMLVHAWMKSTGNMEHESTPLHMAALAERYPEGRFIMAHFGGDFEFGLKAIRHLPNVASDYCGTPNERGAYEMGVRELGPDRVVFGTDGPSCYLTNLGRVLQCPFSDETKQKILAGSFEALLAEPLSR